MPYPARLAVLWLVIVSALIPASYVMAQIGEPRAHWIWCANLGAC